jgi:hypothetical protein
MRPRRNLSLGIGATLVGMLLLTGIFGPLFASHDPLAIDLPLALGAPLRVIRSDAMRSAATCSRDC